MSIGPSSARVVASSRATASSSARSVTSGDRDAAVAVDLLGHPLQLGLPAGGQDHRAPSAASMAARPAPMPVDPPVITAHPPGQCGYETLPDTIKAATRRTPCRN